MPTKSILPAVSLSLNIIVLIPICCLILFNKDAAEFPYDGNTASRQILFCVYLAILLLSVALLIARSYLAPNNTAVGTLLTLQIVYKVLSVGFVTNPINPVKWSNLGIAFFHSWTMYTIRNDIKEGFGIQKVEVDAAATNAIVPEGQN
jgi:NhaP-type Na+/H+ or K+/H+ antiporter